MILTALSLLLSARLHVGRSFSAATMHQRHLSTSLQSSLSTSAQTISTDRLTQLGRASFQSQFNFDLDDWQCQAGGAVMEGSNIIVCAPTGAGKTVIGEMALIHANQLGKRGIYTTPLKALSNQKYTELMSRFSSVGLSTGDISINKGAAVTVMTTEVYRNQAARFGSTTNNDNSLEDTAVVVLDEFHYMGMPGRGSVWEESVITSPSYVQMVALSATLSNARRLAEWIEHVTQRPTILVQVPDSQRPVPLRYLFATRDGLYSLFRDPDAGPGAPHGMLGWKCEESGTVVVDDVRNDKEDTRDEAAGFGSSKLKEKKLPRGLQINPALKAAAEKRMQKVNRSLERAKLDASFGIRKGRSRQEKNDNFFDRPKGAPARKLSAREEQKEKERLLKREMRRAVPSLSALVQRLDQKDLLPAIFFLFSRAGCDEAARGIFQSMRGPRDPNKSLVDEQDDFEGPPIDSPWRKKTAPATKQLARKRESGLIEDASGRTFRPGNNNIDEDFVAAIYESELRELIDRGDYADSSPLSSDNWDFFAKAGLLSYDQVEQVANRIAQFNKNNPEIAFEDEVIEQHLFGVGSHHAGQLPAHKSFAESLFQKQLMKVVFATETLAAGINMPARTTVICALAKRGDGSAMNLLETSNLLQMAGRAGRRGMDTSGTCVILATPFESENDAGKILTDDIKPISSQFTPSYTLAVNLIARGAGRLAVAKVLVRKSFAMWESSQSERIELDAEPGQDKGTLEILQATAHKRFMTDVIDVLQRLVDSRSSMFDIARIESLIQILNDRELLKKASKSFAGHESLIEVERTTLGYLEKERSDVRLTAIEAEHDDHILESLLGEDEDNIVHQTQLQQMRIAAAEKERSKHPLTAITNIVNAVMRDDSAAAGLLRAALQTARQVAGEMDNEANLTAMELSSFSKSAVVYRRKLRKLGAKGDDYAPEQVQPPEEALAVQNDTWNDLLAITRTLVAYGCLTVDPPLANGADIEECTFELTRSGLNLGMLGFENSLWCLAAMGGAWDVVGASTAIGQVREADDIFDSVDQDWYGKDASDIDSASAIPKPQQEAGDLTDRLRAMSPSEIAGYVSCLVSDSDSRGGGGVSVVDRFQRLSRHQQRGIQCSLAVLERLMEVQRRYSVDEKPRKCSFDIANCEVVTEWAAGCSWNEALALAGVPPGDLVRTLSRALDGLRQLGNLQYDPIRKGDLDEKSYSSGPMMPRGLHPEVRRLCRDAAKAINRYPVKDMLSFESQGEEEDDDDIDDDDDDDDLETDIDSELDRSSIQPDDDSSDDERYSTDQDRII